MNREQMEQTGRKTEINMFVSTAGGADELIICNIKS